MGKKLVIVESPTKIKTLKRFLGNEYTFESSIGHIRDLPERRFGIVLDEQVHCSYEILPSKEEVVRKLRLAAEQAESVYLCPDPDREGEAIAWHIRQLLPPEVVTYRASFNSITASEVKRAINQPREIDMHLVDAQQARRVLDRIVGYSLSPLLAQRVQMGKRSANQGNLSAGRVQSVALKLVVEREKAIASFVTQEYWQLQAHLIQPSTQGALVAQLISVEGKRVEKLPKEGCIQIADRGHAQEIKDRLEAATYRVNHIERKQRHRNPVAPFITSTLQQEAFRHFGFSPKRTMLIAQELYEGVDLGKEGTQGLITYMRTDSVHVSSEAEHKLRDYIRSNYSPEYLEATPRRFLSSKSAQEAHEAIRPTNVDYTPANIGNYLSLDQAKLYRLIWNRFVASQMRAAVYDTVQIDIDALPDMILRTTGSVLKFRGFMILYEEKQDEQEEQLGGLLPEVEPGQALILSSVTMKQSFTEPPPRYTEASLVKALEQSGIGRPSTYAAIMNKIESREYTTKEQGRLKPTLLGEVTTQLLCENFAEIMDTTFTAMMEDELEQVARGEKSWHIPILNFWHRFQPSLETAKQHAHVPKITTDRICPSCGGHLQKIWAGRDYFYGCEHYPTCTFRCSSQELDFNPLEYNPTFNWNQPCPICESKMQIKFGPYGVFLGCTKYPDCRGIVSVAKAGESPLGTTGVACPAIGCEGHLMARKSRFGKIFYACSQYPDCDVIGNAIDAIEEKFASHPKTPYQSSAERGRKVSRNSKIKSTGKAAELSKKRVPSKTKAPTTIAAKTRATPLALPKPLSANAQHFFEQASMSRTEALQRLWVYIKTHELQDPSDRRYIQCDEKLSELLEHKRLHMTQLPKEISKLFLDSSTVPESSQ